MIHPRLLMKMICLAGAIVALGLAAIARGDDPQPATDHQTRFLRLSTNGDNRPRALQAAIARYVSSSGATTLRVDLVSAVHVGDKSYYADLNERFRDYDALLFEMIAPKDNDKAPARNEKRSIISSTQILMKNALELSFQLDEIDYGAANFVHADFSPDELTQNMADRGESLYTYFWRVFYAAMAESAKDPFGIREIGKITDLMTADSDNALKLALAYEFIEQEMVDNIFGGANGSALIQGRNQQAMDVLKQQIDNGDRRIGIFYGAAHMPDLERRLIEQLGLERQTIEWVDAWNLESAESDSED